MQILDNKLKSFNKGLIKINTVKAKASQFDHISEEYHKKSLSTRWAKLSNGDIVQRDLYSAFLIQNINETLDNFNMELIDVNYCSFKTQHDILINDLRLDESPDLRVSYKLSPLSRHKFQIYHDTSFNGIFQT